MEGGCCGQQGTPACAPHHSAWAAGLCAGMPRRLGRPTAWVTVMEGSFTPVPGPLFPRCGRPCVVPARGPYPGSRGQEPGGSIGGEAPTPSRHQTHLDSRGGAGAPFLSRRVPTLREMGTGCCGLHPTTRAPYPWTRGKQPCIPEHTCSRGASGHPTSRGWWLLALHLLSHSWQEGAAHLLPEVTGWVRADHLAGLPLEPGTSVVKDGGCNMRWGCTRVPLRC